jgi:hypothetical protein
MAMGHYERDMAIASIQVGVNSAVVRNQKYSMRGASDTHGVSKAILTPEPENQGFHATRKKVATLFPALNLGSGEEGAQWTLQPALD